MKIAIYCEGGIGDVLLDTKTLQACLEHPEFYGPEVKDTGLYDLLNLNNRQTILLVDLQEAIPEFAQLKPHTDKYAFTNNPYTHVMTRRVDFRAFYAGATRDAVDAKLIINKDGTLTEPYIPLTFKMMMDYAKITGEMNKVAEYAKYYVD